MIFLRHISKNCHHVFMFVLFILYITIPPTNMEVEYGLLEDCLPLQTGGFPLP